MTHRFSLPPRAEALVVVAHPDDETIWLGGFILQNPQAHWTILSMSRASDPDRAPKFKRVAEFYQAKGLIDDWDDEGRLSSTAAIAAAKKILLRHLTSKHFDQLFTHGVNGEYGHPMHRLCHQAVCQLLSKQQISVGAAWQFNYKKINRYKLQPKADTDISIKLNSKIFEQKKTIMTKLYGFAPDGIDTGYCTNPESLKLIKQ